MIYIPFGPGGSGKSLWQVIRIVEVLRSSRRNIVTNLALNVPRLAEYLEKLYPNENLRVGERIRLLDVEETRCFWRYRGPVKWVGPDASDYEEDKGAFGVFYVIDEAGACGFDALGWATSVGRSTRGQELVAYLDQQRKYGDDVIASTNGNSPSQIAKGFREKGHVFVALRNEYLAQYWIFRGRGRFVARYYNGEPSRNSEPFKVETWQLDAEGLASCYWTEKGVGVVGTGADKGARAKGISIWWAVVGAFALVAMVGLVPYGVGKVAGSYLGGTKKEPAKNPDGGSQAGALPSACLVGGGSPLPSGGKRGGGAKGPGSAPDLGVTVEQRLHVVGYVAGRGRVTVTLSDGTQLTERDSSLVRIESRFIELSDGRRLPIRPRAGDSLRVAPPVAPVVVAAGAGASSPALESRDEGSWVRGADGVARLRDRER